MYQNRNIPNVLIIILLIITGFECNSQEPLNTSKPNIIYILADDLGYGDLSCYGQVNFQTPNIDKLAKNGMKFTDHYSGNSVCSPSRAVLMTGQHPGNVYITGNSKGEPPLSSEMTVLPEIFKKAGYATGAYGKWGLGYTNVEGERNPLNHGFDEFYGWKTQGEAHTYYPKTMVHNGEEIEMEEGTYVHDKVMGMAFDFIENNAKKKKPFFCYIPTAIPHAAMHAPKELHDKWRKKLPQFEKTIGKYTISKGEYVKEVVNPIAAFPAMVQHLDAQVGEIIEMLEDLGVVDNTIIIFSSDNGAHHEGGHNPEFWNSNGDLKGGKRDVYEGGIRAPMLVYWPGKIEKGSVTNHPSAFWDVMATVSDLLKQPKQEQCDGVSFLPTLLGNDKAQKKADYLYWKFTDWKATKEAVRIGNYKGILIHHNKVKNVEAYIAPFELYDLSKDLGEENNIASQKPKIVGEMIQIISHNN